MSDDKKPTAFRIVSHGIEHAQYFRGHGLAFTRYTDTATGIGSSEREAFEDALDLLAQSGWDVSAIEASEDAQGLSEEERDLAEECWFFVSVDVK